MTSIHSSQVTDKARIHLANNKDLARGRYVLYWMQASQRASGNAALEYALERANDLHLPLLVAFALMPAYPEASGRHYAFMLQGLCETAGQLKQRGIGFCLRIGKPVETLTELAGQAAMLVCDRGYLRHQKLWRRKLARKVDCLVVEVEADVVVPVAVASDKREYAARTIRPRIHKHLAAFLRRRQSLDAGVDAVGLDIPSEPADDWSALLEKLSPTEQPDVSPFYTGGLKEARGRLGAFVRHKLPDYDQLRSDPSLDIQSHLSAYLHFGQISPIEVALAVADSQARQANREAFLEELIVRRELAINYVHYTRDYDSYKALPAWARSTLAKHKTDRRREHYTAEQIESACTDDPYFNAAAKEMVLTGKMHNYMRMYWGKKILEWTKAPRFAHRLALKLNNRYFLDGRDPLSYANVGWIFGLHDRPWQERDIFGQVRYMNAAGLERKFDIGRYVQWVRTLCEQARGA